MLLLASAYGRLGDETHRERYLSRIEREDPLQLVAAALREGPTEAFYQRIGEDRCQAILDAAADLSDMGEAALAAAILKGQPEKCAQTVYVYAHITREKAALKEAGMEFVSASDGDITDATVTENSERIFVVARERGKKEEG